MIEHLSQTLNRLTQEKDLARWSSALTHPVLIAILLILVVVWRDTRSWMEILKWGGSYLLLTTLIPVALLGALAGRGRVINLGHARRRERVKPLLVSMVCLVITAILYQLIDAPPRLSRLAWLQIVQLVLMTAITPAWQISFHGAASGALVITTLLLYGVGTWPLLFLLPLVAWAQVKRGRHTASQVVAGMSLSILLYGLGFGLSSNA